MFRNILVALLTIASLSSADIFFFQDGLLYEREIEDMWKIPDDITVLSVDSDWWKIESFEFNWNDVVRNAQLSRCDDPWTFGDQKILSENPLILTNGSKCFYFIRDPGVWTMFDCPSVKMGKFLRVPSRSKAVLFAGGRWEAVYEFRDGVLTFSGKFSSSVAISGNVKLVTGRFFPKTAPDFRYKGAEVMAVGNAPAPTAKIAERRIYDLGSLKIPKGQSTIKLFSGKPGEIEEIYLAHLSVYSSTDWMNAVYSLEMENTEENGLGYPMPDGRVLAFQNGVPLGNFELEGSPVGGKIRILENESDEILYKLTVNSSYRKGKKYVKDLTVRFKNLSERTVKTLMILKGKSLKILKSDSQPSEVADDYVTFYLDIKPGDFTLKLTVESGY